MCIMTCTFLFLMTSNHCTPEKCFRFSYIGTISLYSHNRYILIHNNLKRTYRDVPPIVRVVPHSRYWISVTGQYLSTGENR